MSERARAFHLLIESLGNSSPAAPPGMGPQPESPSLPERLEVGEGVNFLKISPGRPPALARGGRPARSSDTVLLQSVWREGAPKLLMLIPGGRTVTVNGVPAPVVSLLGERDEVAFDRSSRFIAHVAVYLNPRIGPPEEGEIGDTCPVCKAKFTRETTVYRCHNCSSALHHEGEEKPEGDRLECAGICTECPICHAAIQTSAGYRHIPEGFVP